MELLGNSIEDLTRGSKIPLVQFEKKGLYVIFFLVIFCK